MSKKIIASKIILLAIAAAAGCSSADKIPASNESVVQGTLAMSTFPSVPSAVEARDESGAAARVAIGAGGALRLSLAKGHTYTLAVILGSASEPVVFPRKNGKLDTTFQISTGNAVASLGAVRHLASVPPGGFTSNAVDPADSADDGDDGECVSGVDQSSGAACVDDDAEVTCEGAPVADDQADGECEDGVNAQTGAACVDADDVDAPDPAGPMAVPEHNVPDDVDGCEDGERDGETPDD